MLPSSVAPGRGLTPGTTMLELWVQGNTGAVAALAAIQIAITAAFVALAGLLLKGHKTDA